MKKIIKIAALILALICIGTSCASCGGKNSVGGLIPEPDKSQIIGVGARIYVFGDDVSGIGEKTNFTIDKTTNSTQEFISALKDLYAPEDVNNKGADKYIFTDANVMEGNYLKIDLGIINGNNPYNLHISITLPEKIKKVTLTCRQAPFWEYSEAVIENFGTLSDDKKTLSFVGKYGELNLGTDKENFGTLRIYY